MRKGLVGSEAVLVGLVVILMVAVVISVILKELVDTSNQEFSEQECKASIELTRAVDDFLSVACVVPTPSLSLKCTREFITAEEDRVMQDAKDVTRQYSSECPAGLNSEGGCLPQNVVAEEMASCWNMFFQGEIPALQQVEVNSMKFWERKDSMRSCFVCSEITLTSDANNLGGYLRDAEYDEGVTYYSFIAENEDAYCDPDLKSRAGTCWKGIADGTEYKLFDKQWPPLDTQYFMEPGTYAVTYVRRGMGSCETAKTYEKEIASSIIAVSTLGINNPDPSDVIDSYLTNTVQVIPTDEISRYCDVVVV